MYKVRVTIDDDVLDSLNEAYQKSPRTIAVFLNRSLLPQYTKRAAQELTPYPGPVVYPIEWASEKQRRAFFATDGFGGGIPTRRSGKLQQSWEFDTTAFPDGGDITLANTSEYARYVIGADQQPFHRNTGWQLVDDAAAVLTDDLTDEVIDLYFQIMDGTFA